MDSIIIKYAKKIAQYQGYPRLDNELQPIEAYEVDGKSYPGLEAKYQREWIELRDAYANWQSEQGKTQWHVLHEAADVYYYSQQLEAQSRQPLWDVAIRSVKNYLPHEWSGREIKTAARAKYKWRSSAPSNKNEDYEIGLIKEAVKALAPMGRPYVFEDSQPFELKQLSKDLIDYVDQKREDQSRRAFVEVALREYMGLHPIDED